MKNAELGERNLKFAREGLKEVGEIQGGHLSPFERIKRTNETGNDFWSSRDLAEVLGYGDYRNFEAVIEKAKLACSNSGQRSEDHFVDVTDMVAIGSGATGRSKRRFL